MKRVKKNQKKMVIFTAVKNRCILHWRVFVMKILAKSCVGGASDVSLILNLCGLNTA